MDEADRAQEMVEQLDELRMRRVPRRVPPPVPSSERCVGCGDPIPEERRLAMPGVERCVDCQSEVEG